MLLHTAVLSNVSAKVSTTVPTNLPLSQWESQVFKESAEVFVDIQACLTKFEDIMGAHLLDMDANFARVIPPLLSATARTWYEHFITTFKNSHQKSPSWQEFKVAFKERYGYNVHEERLNCARQLTNITMNTGESNEEFIERFNELRPRAVDQVMPNAILIEHFGRAILQNLHREVSVAASTLPDFKKTDIDVITSLVREFHNKSKHLETVTPATQVTVPSTSRTPSLPARIVSASVNNVTTTGATATRDLHQQSNLSRHAVQHTHPYAAPVNSANHQSNVVNFVPRAPRTVNRYCSYHQTRTHNTNECRVAAANGPNFNKFCRNCGAPGWSREHRCNTAIRANGPPATFDTPRFAAMYIDESSPHNGTYTCGNCLR